MLDHHHTDSNTLKLNFGFFSLKQKIIIEDLHCAVGTQIKLHFAGDYLKKCFQIFWKVSLYVTKCYNMLSINILNILTGVASLDLHPRIKQDFEILTSWAESVDNVNIRLVLAKIWRDPSPALVENVSGELLGFKTSAEGPCIAVTWMVTAWWSTFLLSIL